MISVSSYYVLNILRKNKLINLILEKIRTSSPVLAKDLRTRRKYNQLLTDVEKRWNNTASEEEWITLEMSAMKKKR